MPRPARFGIILCTTTLTLFSLTACGGGSSDSATKSPAVADTERALDGRVDAPPAGASLELAALSLETSEVAAAVSSEDGRYRMAVPSGTYAVVSLTVLADAGPAFVGDAASVTIARRRSQLVAFHPGAFLARAPHTVQAGGPVIGIGNIPMSGPPGLGLGGDALGPLLTGLVDPCRNAGGKVVDLSDEVREALRNEQWLSDQGKLATKVLSNPTPPTIVVTGTVVVGADGRPRADLRLVDPATGAEIKRVVVDGDPAEGSDISPFLRRVGVGVADACAPRTTPTAESTGVAGTPMASEIADPSTTATVAPGDDERVDLDITSRGGGSVRIVVDGVDEGPQGCGTQTGLQDLDVPYPNFACKRKVRRGADVVLTAVTFLETGRHPGAETQFLQWGGDCLSAGSGKTCSFVVNDTKKVVAAFDFWYCETQDPGMFQGRGFFYMTTNVTCGPFPILHDSTPYLDATGKVFE